MITIVDTLKIQMEKLIYMIKPSPFYIYFLCQTLKLLTCSTKYKLRYSNKDLFIKNELNTFRNCCCIVIERTSFNP